MRDFSRLYLELDQTTRTGEKLEALVRYFRTAHPGDAIWAVYFLTGRKVGRAISFRRIRDWASEVSGYAHWLMDECYTLVGDLSETLSLILPERDESAPAPTLREVVEETLRPLGIMSEQQQKKSILAMWRRLDQREKLVFHKLLSREFRVGVSRQMVVNALADAAGVDSQIMAHRLAGNWSADEETMRRLLSPVEDTEGKPRDATLPYPFLLAHPLAEEPASLGEIGDWLLEWKWDGIRAQIIRREGKVTLWSRGDEIVTSAFPEIVQAARELPDGTVLDGEIIGWDEVAERPLPFAKLQTRINRKNVEMSLWPDVPVVFIAFDLLEFEGRDIRGEMLVGRRKSLDGLLGNSMARPGDTQATEAAPTKKHSALRGSMPLEVSSWDELESLIGQSRERGVEGLMLKGKQTPYKAGRVTGLWWKLKVEPYSVDCVLIAAQSGHGRRAGLLTDYTFGVWHDGTLVSFAKAYSGLTDEEILEVDGWARRHTLERFGPVHFVEPARVFELGFEAIQKSARHKSGIAVRFPRMLRERKDKKAEEADTLKTLQELRKSVEGVA
jgi:DNA ligase-1